MENNKPSICKSEEAISLCDCTDNNLKEEQKNTLLTVVGRKYIMGIIDF